MITHTPEYARNTVTGRWRARCTACKWWVRIGTREEVLTQFAIHDIEQWEVQPDTPDQAIAPVSP